MTSDDVIRMAQKAGFEFFDQFPPDYQRKIERFAELVAADEREVCICLCNKFGFGQAPEMIANAIRARAAIGKAIKA